MFQFAEVGGAVRDELLGLKAKDVDFVAVPHNPEFHRTASEAFNNLVKHLEWMGFQVFLETPEFFTVRAKPPVGHPLRDRTEVADFVLARKDGPSSDGRRPDFVLPGTLLDDLERRDFTVNAMARLNGELVDPFGGQSDLEHGILRFVGNPMDRIAEDGLRVMRAFRFCVTKRFTIEDRTFNALNSHFAAEMLAKVSVERVREEMEKMFKADTLGTMSLLNELFSLNKPLRDAMFREGLRLMPTLKK